MAQPFSIQIDRIERPKYLNISIGSERKVVFAIAGGGVQFEVPLDLNVETVHDDRLLEISRGMLHVIFTALATQTADWKIPDEVLSEIESAPKGSF